MKSHSDQRRQVHLGGWTPALIEAHLQLAADTMRRLPQPRVAGYYNGWPEVLRDAFEMRGTSDGPPSLAPATPDAITDAEQVMLWLRWLDRDDQQLLWARANRRAWKAIAAELRMHRSTAGRRYKYALMVIAAHLNAFASENATTSPHQALRQRRPDVL